MKHCRKKPAKKIKYIKTKLLINIYTIKLEKRNTMDEKLQVSIDKLISNRLFSKEPNFNLGKWLNIKIQILQEYLS